MSIEAIAFLPPSQAIEVGQIGQVVAQQPTSTFESWLGSQLDQVNTKLVDAENQVQRLAVGDVENLHQVMIKVEDAKLSFQLAMQVRNRVLEAYQEVLRMQV